MNSQPKDSLLSIANSALREGDFEYAVQKYEEALEGNSSLSKIIKFNLALIEVRRDSAKRRRTPFEEEPASPNKSFSWREDNHSDLSPVLPKTDGEKNLKRFGAAFLGPIFSAFFHKLRQELKNNTEIRELFFLSREGYFLELAFKRILQNPEEQNLRTSYLICSRTLLFKLSLLDPDNREGTLEHHYFGKMVDFLKSRYAFTDLELSEIRLSSKTYREIEKIEIDFQRNKHLILLVLQEAHNVISKMVKPKYDAYVKYLNELGFLKYKDAHIVDIGFSGTIQRLLHKIQKQNITGHYFLTTKKANSSAGLVFKGHILGDISPGTEPLLDRSLYMEAILTAPYGQTVDVGEDKGKVFFCFGNKTTAQHRFRDLRMIVEGAIDYSSLAVNSNLVMTTRELSNYYSVFVSQKNNFPESICALFNIDDKISGFETINPIDFFLKQ